MRASPGGLFMLVLAPEGAHRETLFGMASKLALRHHLCRSRATSFPWNYKRSRMTGRNRVAEPVVGRPRVVGRAKFPRDSAKDRKRCCRVRFNHGRVAGG